MHTLLLLLLAACSGRTEPEEPFVPTLENGGCGLDAYEWLPTDGMGELVFTEWLSDYSFSASAIDAMLGAADDRTAAFTPVPYGVEVHRVRYVSQDRGEPVEVTGLIALPDVDGPTTVPTAAWLHPTTGWTDACAPSALGLEGVAGPMLLAALGFATVAPDYLGMIGTGAPSEELHPYIAAEPTAVVSLDALRALWRFVDEQGGDLEVERQVVLWGASEGGFAALQADRYASGYLPEAEILATVAAVPPTDLLGLAQHGVSTVEPATAGLAAVLATSNPWYGRPGDLEELFTEPVASGIEDALWSGCDDGGLLDGMDEVTDLFLPEAVDAFLAGDWDAVEPWTCMFERSTLRLSPIPRDHDAPVLMVVGERDDLVVGEVERADAPRLCEAGYRLEYLECDEAGHVDAAADSLAYQWAWVQARLRGEALEDPCVVGDPVDCRAL